MDAPCRGTLKSVFNLLWITTSTTSFCRAALQCLIPSPELPHPRCRFQHLPFIWLVTAQPSDLSMPLCLGGTQELPTICCCQCLTFSVPQRVTTKISAALSSKKQTYMDSESKADKLSQPRIQLSCSTNVLLRHSRKWMHFDFMHQCEENGIWRLQLKSTRPAELRVDIAVT